MVDPLIQRRPSMTDGEALKQAIRRRGYEIPAFAKVAGVDQSTIYSWISGRRSTRVSRELKIRLALSRLPVLFGDILSDQPLINAAVPLPPAAMDVLPSAPRLAMGEPPSMAAVLRKPAAALLTTDRDLDPILHEFVAALAAVPELEAWRKFGFHLFSSPQGAAHFRRELEAGRPWNAFEAYVGDEAYFRLTEDMVVLGHGLGL